MALKRLLAGGLAALSLQASALQSGQTPPSALEAARLRSCLPNGAYRMELENMMDLQYYGKFELGGQMIRGIIDTGSFELVVFSKSCHSCGMASKYSETASTTFRKGNNTAVQAYGSGSCESDDGWDDINLACFGAKSQSMWLAKKCQMPALLMAQFNAVIGIGPPGQPEFTARMQLEEVKKIEESLAAQGKKLPQDVEQAKTKLEGMLADALQKPAMLENFGIKTFSHCLGRKKGSPGYMVWNDDKRDGAPGTMKIHVAGNITWGIQIDEMSFSMPGGEIVPFGCKGGCGAVVDSGTSLTAVPTSTYKAALKELQGHFTGSDCSDLSQYPDLIIKTGGHSLRLPPSSYLGTVSSMMGGMGGMSGIAKYLHLDKLGGEVASDPETVKAATAAAAAAARAAEAANQAAAAAATAAKAAAEAAQMAAKAAGAAVGGDEPAVSPQGSIPGAPTGKADPCQLLMMDIGEKQTPLGPMLILGMPFFRQFYTTFDLGAGRGDRSLFVTKASDDCEPIEEHPEALKAFRMRRSDDITARRLDASLIRGPHWLDSIPEGEF